MRCVEDPLRSGARRLRQRNFSGARGGPMTIVGGFDVHRKQLTFDYVDTETGEIRSGQIRPGTRKMLRSWLAPHCPNGDGEFALEGCTGWRYVAEELTGVGAVAQLSHPAAAAG